MTYFLEHIADSLHNEFGNTLNRHCLVFPNRRAGLYFMKYLASGIKKPVWVPAVLTINDLFSSYSSLQIPGNEILLFELYKVYSTFKKPAESFDEFYFWGEMLLNDFDDVDKYMVDATTLFKNVLDIKNIDRLFGDLSEEQIKIIAQFWTNFNRDKITDEKNGFIEIWSILNNLYSGFRDSLRKQKLAYEGMIFRDFATNPADHISGDTRWEMFHFIGFNALNECEKTLMLHLKNYGKARFYWDYDNSYIKGSKLNSAGFFLRENIQIFGNDMPEGWSYDTLLSAKNSNVHRRVIETSSDIAQVKLIPQLLREIPGLSDSDAHHTAVVLADENLLPPLLTSLPEDNYNINITMGYPLKQSLVYSFLKYLFRLQQKSVIIDGTARFNYEDVAVILKHSLTNGLLNETDLKIAGELLNTKALSIPENAFSSSESLGIIFRRPSDPAGFSEYLKEILSVIASDSTKDDDNNADVIMQNNIRNEFIYRIMLAINRLGVIIRNSGVSFSIETYIKILERMLMMQSVPFSGEPLNGVQMMGILETRTLDFKNLIILSVNEGVLPSVSTGSSFIPFSLREAFGIPSINHQESVYAYHFYRLLHRAENVTFVFNSNSEGLRSGEMSRFLVQMKYSDTLKPVFSDLSFEIKPNIKPVDIIERTEVHSDLLASLYLSADTMMPLSPSAINAWLFCRMKFYYRYVNRLTEPEDSSSDIDPAMLGSILHDSMKKLYGQYKNELLSVEILDSIIKNKHLIDKVINDSVNEKFKSGMEFEISGSEIIVREVLKEYILRILNTDKQLAPLVIRNLEDRFVFKLQFPLDGNLMELMTGGIIDRVDEIKDVIRIVDYKTGSVSDSISSIDDLFLDNRNKDSDGWLQTLLYCEAFLSAKPDCRTVPSIYKIKKMNNLASSGKLVIKSGKNAGVTIENYDAIREAFLDGLKDLLSKIFDKNEPFIKTTDIRNKCTWCPYKKLCMR